MRFLFIMAALLWLMSWITIGVISLFQVPNQMARDKAFIEQEIKPSVELVKSFRKQHHRLPTDKEFDSIATKHNGSVSYIRQLSGIVTEEDEQKFKQINWDNNFAIGVWRGEWEEYYLSWSDSYESNNYSWKDGLMEFVFCAFLGGLPLLVWWLVIYKREKRVKLAVR